jgi:hypothetical protein
MARGGPQPSELHRGREAGRTGASSPSNPTTERWIVNWLWTVRSSDGGMNGLEFCRSFTAGDLRHVLVHAAPSQMELEVRTEDGALVAGGRAERTEDYSPITELRLDGDGIHRREIWPTDDHLGLPVLLPGGEVGVLTAWRHADDHTWWQWSVEFSNHRDRPADWQPPEGQLRR